MAIAYQNQKLNVNDIHGRLEKFIPKGRQDIADAQFLQDFFQGLKRYISGQRNITLGGLVQDMMLADLVQQIELEGKKITKNYNISNLFNVRGGTRFEHEIERVFLAIVNKAFTNFGNAPIPMNTFVTGTAQGTPLNDIINSDLSKNFAKKLSEDLGRSISQAEVIQLFQAGTLNRSVKIDVDFTLFKGNIDITYDNPYLNKLFNLLREATFTAKNYDSKRIVGKDIETNNLILEDATGGVLHLGNTYDMKAIYGSLRYLGYSKSVAISHAFRSHYSEDTDLTTHAYHLKSLYELTGAGIVYKGEGTLGRIAKYIIFNDPHGDIYVKSTLGIIQDMMNNNSPFVGQKSIAITKEYFY